MADCITFQNKLGELKLQSSELEGLITAFTQSPDPGIFEQFQKKMEEAKLKKESFMEEYQAKAREMLVKWLKSNPDHPGDIPDITFEDSGRAVISRFGAQEDMEINYMPGIIRRVAGFCILAHCKIRSADFIEEIDDFLSIGDKVSLRSLKKVGGHVGFGEQNIDFRKVFPNLKYVGVTPNPRKTGSMVSFYLKSPRLASQIENEKKAGKIEFSGDIWLVNDKLY